MTRAGIFQTIIAKLGKTIALLLVLLIVPGTARASGFLAPGSGWYFEGGFYAPENLEHESDLVSPNVAAANGSVETSPEDGWGFALRLGKYLTERTRIEAQYSHARSNDLHINYNKINPANPFFGLNLQANGSVTVDAFGANVLFTVADFRLLGFQYKPFIGAGVGVLHVDVFRVAPVGSRFVPNDSDTMFTGSLIVGLDKVITEKLTLSGRYAPTWVEDSSFRHIDTLNAGGIATTEVDSRIAHYIGVALRYRP